MYTAIVPGAMTKKTADPRMDCDLVKFGALMNGAPGEARTPDNPLRRRVLYPTELRAPVYVFLHVTEKLALFETSLFGCATSMSAQPR